MGWRNNNGSPYLFIEPYAGADPVQITGSNFSVSLAGAITGQSIALGGGGSTLSSYVENTFSPTVTLVGGSGNTVPTYSTNNGRYTRIGRQVFVDVYLTGVVGNNGAGGGVINIALPITASASHDPDKFLCGHAFNGTTGFTLAGSIAGGGTTIALYYVAYSPAAGEADFTGGSQNNATTRTIRLKFAYEV